MGLYADTPGVSAVNPMIVWGGGGASEPETGGPSGDDAHMDVAAVLIALVTLVAGLAAGWAIGQSRAAAGQASLLAERAAARAETAAARSETVQVRGERDTAAESLREPSAAASEATARLESERAAFADKLALLDRAQAQLKETFASLSRDALDKNNQRFLAIADERFKQAGAPL